MATISTGQITNVSGGSVTSKATGSIVLPANTLVFCDVLTHNTTPANLQTPTLAGTGGETWVQEASDTNGGASPGIRVTRFRTMVATDTTTVVTATCTLSQTNIDVEVFWVGGVSTAGSDGAGACGASQTQNSGGSNVTSASKSLGAPAHPRNGFVATCRAPTGAMGNRSGWSEIYDSAGSGSYGQLQVQTIDKPDTAWSMTCSSGTYVVIITEVIAAPAPAIIAQVQARSTAAISASTSSFTFVAQANRTYIIIAIGSTSITGFTPASPGLTWTLMYHPTQASNGNEMYVYATRVTFGGEYTVQISGMAGTGGNGSWGTLEVACDAAAYPPYGFIQTAHLEHNTGGVATETFSISAPASRQSCMFWYQCNGNTGRLSLDGWQNCPTISNSSFGAGSFRANADNAAKMTWSTGLGVNPMQAWFAEFAGLEDDVEGDAPVIALVSPAEGAISETDDIVVDVTDADGDLSRVTLYLAMPLVGIVEAVYDWDTSAFLGAYTAASSVTPIANGFRFTLDRGGWVDENITLHVVAHDEESHETVDDFAWTTDFEGSYSCDLAGEPPVITVESPLPYDDPDFPIDPADPLVFTITDEDAEPGLGAGLERALPVIMFPDGTDALVHDGDAFRPRFYGSTREAITGGYRYTVVWFTGRWPQPPTLMPYAYDLRGNEAA